MQERSAVDLDPLCINWAEIETEKPLIKKLRAFCELCHFMSGWQDSNLRPPHPKCGAIPGYATPRSVSFVPLRERKVTVFISLLKDKF